MRLPEAISWLWLCGFCIHRALIDSIKAGKQTVPRTETDMCQPRAYCRAEYRVFPCVFVPLWQIHHQNLYNKV